jgi:ABC-2 type transport system permease protein
MQSLKRIFSSKLKLLIIFLCPALFTAMFMTTTKSALSLLVVDNDRSALSERLVASLGSLDAKIVVKPAAEETIDDRIISYQADEAVIIPKGFEDAILSGESPVVEEFHILDTQGVFYAKAFIDGFVSDMRTLAAGATYDRDAFGKALAVYDNKPLGVRSISEENDDDIRAWSYGSLGFLVQFMLYMSIITAGVVLEDRSSGVFYRTFFAPVSLKRYFTENLLAFFVIGAMQVTVSIVLLITVFGMHLGNLLAVFVLFFVAAFVCIALGMWLVTLFKKPVMAYLSVLFLTTPLIMLGGCYWPSSYMPDMVVKLAKFLPTSWIMQAVDKILNQGAGMGQIGLELLVLLLFAGVFMAAGLVKKVDIAK